MKKKQHSSFKYTSTASIPHFILLFACCRGTNNQQTIFGFWIRKIKNKCGTVISSVAGNKQTKNPIQRLKRGVEIKIINLIVPEDRINLFIYPK
jgi:hypothetical protein